ncbi:hypothetical protein HYPDE_30358 [Hyphomicrobium denitrificans 1NES1]|uniref:Uncharacterized protein n=1 Tax=Hyphomicrobium denitrificans 1NES1 TaxID=670307 RepID=N0BB34_9HYPH|nr:hypothetical protein [Hyphomicrobium denitrificans]AGK57746.1 hypothetical protein HYPDE_30358 [Hyphomicrobium denitrificans 1NES1]
MAPAIIDSSFGRSAAAETAGEAKSTPGAPISLAGRWSGKRYGYGRSKAESDCGSGCTLAYDFVACKEGWCGIAVKDDKTCGAIGVRLASNASGTGGGAFKGQLVLAKGSAPYAVEAWYRTDDEIAKLHFLGDTGPELRIMRRSFPFEADLARTGDAVCTLEKATS